jgi:hypothetical protein
VLSPAEQELADQREADKRKQAASFGLAKWRKISIAAKADGQIGVSAELTEVGERAKVILTAWSAFMSNGDDESTSSEQVPTAADITTVQNEMKRQLKQWEARFAAVHEGKAPTATDKKAIREWYAQYQLLRKASKEAKRKEAA